MQRENDLGTRIAVLESQFENMESKQAEMASDVKEILAAISEAKGGWKVMLMIGGSAGMVGAFIGKWLATIIGVMPK